MGKDHVFIMTLCIKLVIPFIFTIVLQVKLG